MSTKRQRAMTAYGGFAGGATVAHIERNIEAAYPEAYHDLTGVQYGQVMAVANKSYHDGKAAAGAECVDGDLVIVGKRCWPLALMEKLTVETKHVTTYVPAGTPGGCPASRGGNSDYYRKTGEGETYKRIEWRQEAEDLLRGGEQIYFRNDDTHTSVKLDGVEIACYPYLL
jgi:hypothetical protein